MNKENNRTKSFRKKFQDNIYPTMLARINQYFSGRQFNSFIEIQGGPSSLVQQGVRLFLTDRHRIQDGPLNTIQKVLLVFVKLKNFYGFLSSAKEMILYPFQSYENLMKQTLMITEKQWSITNVTILVVFLHFALHMEYCYIFFCINIFFHK